MLFFTFFTPQSILPSLVRGRFVFRLGCLVMEAFVCERGFVDFGLPFPGWHLALHSMFAADEQSMGSLADTHHGHSTAAKDDVQTDDAVQAFEEEASIEWFESQDLTQDHASPRGSARV